MALLLGYDVGSSSVKATLMDAGTGKVLSAATWQGTLKRGSKLYGKRTVEAYLQRPKFELYDLEIDPHEVKNLADDPQYKDKLEEMKTKLKAFQKRTKDPWILKWDYE